MSVKKFLNGQLKNLSVGDIKKQDWSLVMHVVIFMYLESQYSLIIRKRGMSFGKLLMKDSVMNQYLKIPLS